MRNNRHLVKVVLISFTLLVSLLFGLPSTGKELKEKEESRPAMQVPIVLYHRFGSEAADSMTVRTSIFESQVKYLMENGYTVIPLRQLVDYRLGRKNGLPTQSVVITVDDGHKSVYTDMFPILRKYRIAATLFLYPSAISNAPYAMTWDQLREIKSSGLVDFQSHTLWHPNFKKDRGRLTPVDYENFVEMQFKKSKERLEKELDTKVDMLAWPFGIYDYELIHKAIETGYVAAFTMERHHSNISDRVMALPRFLITNDTGEKGFGRLLVGPRCS